MYKKIFPASLDHLYDMLAFVHQFSFEKGFNDGAIDKITLATEEALVNIIHHGYPVNKGEIEIQCSHTVAKPGIKILIKDYGIPFDPTKEIKKIKKKRYKSSSLEEEISIGGYGIFIYIGLMDRVEYYRTDDGNLLFLIKYL